MKRKVTCIGVESAQRTLEAKDEIPNAMCIEATIRRFEELEEKVRFQSIEIDCLRKSVDQLKRGLPIHMANCRLFKRRVCKVHEWEEPQ